MKNLTFFVQQFEESEKNDLINNAKKLLQELICKDEINTLPFYRYQPFFFSTSHLCVETSLCDRIFNACYNSRFLFETKSNNNILISLITQIASLDFIHFVDNYVPLMIKSEDNMGFIFAKVATIILNPLSCFLHHIASFQKNIQYKKKYDFFNLQSPDFDTPIGKALTRFRSIIVNQILELKKTQNKHAIYEPSKSIYTNSILHPYKHSEISFNSNTDEILLGHPDQSEILYICSFFLNQEMFTKEKKYAFFDDDIVSSWETYYKEITGFDIHQKNDNIPLFHMKTSDNYPVLFHFLKLIPFLGLSSLQLIINDEMELITKILGEDLISASFYQNLCQILLLTDEKFPSRLFEAILIVSEKLRDLSNNQYHTFIHSIYRFIEILCFHENCRISEHHITQLNSLALVSFCSVHREIRKASLKLIRALGRLDPKISPIWNFIESNGELFDNFISDFFEKYQKMSSVISPAKIRPKEKLSLDIALSSQSPTLWQIFLAAFGKAAAVTLDRQVIAKFKEKAASACAPPLSQMELQLKMSQNSSANLNLSTYISAYFSLNSFIDQASSASQSPMQNLAAHSSSFSVASPGSVANYCSATPQRPYARSVASPNSAANLNSATPQNLNSATPQNLNSVTPQNLNSATPQNLNSVTPQNLNSATPQNLNSATPQNLNSATPQNLNSATPQNLNSATPQKTNLNSITTPSSIASQNSFSSSSPITISSSKLNSFYNSSRIFISPSANDDNLYLSKDARSSSELESGTTFDTQFCIQAATLLVPLTQVDDATNSKAIQMIFFYLKTYHSSKLLDSLLIMTHELPTRTIDSILNILLEMQDNVDNLFTQLILLWSISRSIFSIDFIGSEIMIDKFIEVFLNTTIYMTNNGLLFFTLKTTLSRNEEKIMTDYAVPLTIYTTVCYRIFYFLWDKLKSAKNECFPCRAYVNTSEHKELLKFSLLYMPLLNMALFENKSNALYGDRLKSYSIQTLSQFFSCCKLDNIRFLFDDISVQFEGMINCCPSILQHLLEHNFEEVFPIILQKSLKPNGIICIKALAHFFRSSDEGFEISISDMLTQQQWANICPIKKLSTNLEVVYENCGSFLFACILYIIISDSDTKIDIFILLITMTPILLLFEDGGKVDNTSDLIYKIAQICSKLDHPSSTDETVRLFGLDQILSEKFSFCTEQLFKAAFDNLPLFKEDQINQVLSSIVPWFSTIHFDYEERVLFKNTDTFFLNFSCYTFIQNLSTSFLPTKDLSNIIYDVWKVLVITDNKPNDNFLPVLLILFDLGENTESMDDPLINIIYFLSTLNPSFVLMITTSKISFSDYFMKHKNTKEKKNQNNYRFILKCLIRLCKDFIQATLPYLNIIFAFSVIFYEIYFNEIIELLKSVINSIKPFIKKKSKESYEILKCSIYQAKKKRKIDSFQTFLISFDENEINSQSVGFKMELLRWGLCCGDLSLSSSALNAKPIIYDDIIIGLTARALSSISTAIINTEPDKKQIYFIYIKSVISFLSSLSAGITNNDPSSALFWISCELLKCSHREIFNEALKLFDSFVSDERLFSLVNGSISIDQVDELSNEKKKNVFTEKSLFKYHTLWNEDYEGCVTYILLNANSDFELVTNVLLHLIQIKYPKLLSDKKNCLSMILLVLLPCFWNEFAASIQMPSKKIKEIEKSFNSIQKMIDNSNSNQFSQSFLESFAILKNAFDAINRIKLREMMINTADLLIKDIEDSDTQIIASFFTTSLEYGPKTMFIPLVVIVTHIARAFLSIQIYLKEFTFLLTKNEIIATETIENSFSCRNNDVYEFISLFKKKIGPNNNIENPNDNESKSNNTDDKEKHANGNDDKTKENNNINNNNNNNENDSHDINNITYDNNNEDDFPVLKFFDRIVVVLIPHLFESNVGYQVNFEFSDLNSFPPLLPYDESILEIEKFQNLENFIQQIEVYPLSDWEQAILKMKFSLYDDNYAPQKLIATTPEINVSEILNEQFNKIISKFNEIFAFEEEEEKDDEEEEISFNFAKFQDKNLFLKGDDAYNLVAIQAFNFVPSIDLANSIGDDLFDEFNSQEDNF